MPTSSRVASLGLAVTLSLSLLARHSAEAQLWLDGNGIRSVCPSIRPIIKGLCVKSVCQNQWPLDCSSLHSLAGSKMVTKYCVSFGSMFECPSGTVLKSLCVSNSTYRCYNTVYPGGCDNYVECVATSQPAVHSEACEWRSGNATTNGISCFSDEIAAGLCTTGGSVVCNGDLSTDTAYIKCCYTGTSGVYCSVQGYWEKNLGTACAADTSVVAYCSNNCDPLGALTTSNTAGNVTNMYFCQGTTFTNPSNGYWTTCADGMVQCNDGYVVMKVRQCTTPLQTVQAYCQLLRFSYLSTVNCVISTGEGNRWCPEAYAMIGFCGAGYGGMSKCVENSNVSTYIKCCLVRQYYQGGVPCQQNIVYTALGAMRARSIPYGLNTDAPAGFALKRFSDGDVCATCYYAYACSMTSDASYVYVTVGSLGGDPTQGDIPMSSFVIRFPIGGLDPRVEWVAGQLTSRGYNKPDDTLTKHWTRRFNMLFDFTEQATIIPADAYDALLISEGTMIRIMSTSFTNNWYAALYTGNNTERTTFINGTNFLTARFTTVHTATYFRESKQELFIGAYGYILYQTGSTMWYFAGNGIPNDGTTPYPSDNTTFRTDMPIGAVQGITVDDDQIMYFTDSGSDDGIAFIDLQTGRITGLHCGMQYPNGIALYTPIDQTQGKVLFVTGAYMDIWKVNIEALTSVSWAGSQDFGAISVTTDRVPLQQARFWGLTTLIATRNQLYIADKQNSAIRVVNLNSCTVQFNSTMQCRSCNSGYYWYPQCRNVCTLENDCLSRASAVSGSQPSSCSCSCVWPFTGQLCRACVPRYDITFGCRVCLTGFVGLYPNCKAKSKTLTVSKHSYSLTGTALPTGTTRPGPTHTTTPMMTFTLPSTPTRKHRPTGSHTRRAHRSVEGGGGGAAGGGGGGVGAAGRDVGATATLTLTHLRAIPVVSTSSAKRDFGLDGELVSVTVVTGYGSTLVAAVLSPASANKPSIIAREVDGSTCSVLDGDGSTFPMPDSLALLPSASPGDTPSVTASGMLVTTLAVHLLTLLLNAAIGRRA